MRLKWAFVLSAQQLNEEKFRTNKECIEYHSVYYFIFLENKYNVYYKIIILRCTQIIG